jgi:hypothetical protein
MVARFRRRRSATPRSSAIEGEVGASARPTGAGRTSDGPNRQPQKNAGRQSRRAAGQRPGRVASDGAPLRPSGGSSIAGGGSQPS